MPTPHDDAVADGPRLKRARTATAAAADPGCDAVVDPQAWWAGVKHRRQRYMLTIEYVGSEYHGSQRQSSVLGADPSWPTVQDDLEVAARKLVPRAPRAPAVVFCGRTDTGVHATGSVVHLDIVRTDRAGQALPAFSEQILLRSLSANLPKARIGVLSARQVPVSFHAQRSARMRTYVYRIRTAAGGTLEPARAGSDPPADSPAVLRTGCVMRNRSCKMEGWGAAAEDRRALCLTAPLDIEAMRAAAVELVGRRDFSAFRGSKRSSRDAEESPVRTLEALEVVVEQRDTLSTLMDAACGQSISVLLRAPSFVRSMVRYLVACLVEVA